MLSAAESKELYKWSPACPGGGVAQLPISFTLEATFSWICSEKPEVTYLENLIGMLNFKEWLIWFINRSNEPGLIYEPSSILMSCHYNWVNV